MIGMFLYTSFLFLILSSAMSKPRYVELDEEDQELFRTAYETPAYHDDCDDGEDLQLGKLDLIKDGAWALKAKIKELKAFNKALAANLLTTKLKLKELIMNSAIEKKQKFESLEKKKPLKYQLQDPHYAQYAAIPFGYDPYIGI